MRPFRSSPSLTAVTDCITGPSWPHNRFAGVSGSSVLGPQLGLQRTVHLVQRAELLVLDDADLAVRPAHNPVTRVDRSLGLNDRSTGRSAPPRRDRRRRRPRSAWTCSSRSRCLRRCCASRRTRSYKEDTCLIYWIRRGAEPSLRTYVLT